VLNYCWVLVEIAAYKEAVEVFWSTEFYKCHAVAANANQLFVLFPSAIPRHLGRYAKVIYFYLSKIGCSCALLSMIRSILLIEILPYACYFKE
jgi:hypothetical protein